MMVSNHDLGLGNCPISRLGGKGIPPLEEHGEMDGMLELAYPSKKRRRSVSILRGDQFVTGWCSRGTDLGHSDASSSEYHRIVQIVYNNFCELGVGMRLGSRGMGGMEGESNETEIDVLDISVRLIL